MAHDVEFRTREIIQEAGKFMMHSRRTKLTVNDVNMALEAKNVDVNNIIFATCLLMICICEFM